MSNNIWVRSGRKDNRVALFEQNRLHPGGEAFVAGAAPVLVAPTGRVKQALAKEDIVALSPEESSALEISQGDVGEDPDDEETDDEETPGKGAPLASDLGTLMNQVGTASELGAFLGKVKGLHIAEGLLEALEAAGITSVDTLLAANDSILLGIDGIGKKTLERIRALAAEK